MAASRRPLVLIVGAGVALAAAVGLGLVLVKARREAPVATLDPAAPAPARRLTLEVSRDARSDVGKPLRCFVDGKFVGLETVADCARKNGVDPKSLDVGLDQTGALAAGESVPLQPLPAADLAPTGRIAHLAPPPQPPQLDLNASPVGYGAGGAETGDCLRYAQGWRTSGRGVPLNQCVRILFNGHCLHPGQALYGRWTSQTVRLVPGRVEVSDDNRDFRPLMDQDPDDCTLPAA